MASNTLKLGRDLANDIVLQDPKCSRFHAKVEIQADGIKIKNLSSSSKIIVDGVETDEAYIYPNSKIIIGNTQISILLDTSPVSNSTNDLNIAGMATQPEKKSNPLWIAYGLLIIGGLYLFISEDTQAPTTTLFKDEKAIQQEIEEARKITEQLQNLRYTSGRDSRQYMDAQASYLKGFRDFREGNYARAITSFEAALALHPSHPLATSYLNISRRKLDESIQLAMQEGNLYMEQGKYRFAMSSFRNAMVLIRDPNNPNYKEAKAKHDKCESILEGRF